MTAPNVVQFWRPVAAPPSAAPREAIAIDSERRTQEVATIETMMAAAAAMRKRALAPPAAETDEAFKSRQAFVACLRNAIENLEDARGLLNESST